VLSPFAIIFLVVLESSLAAAFVEGGLTISLMLLLLGPITAVPLLAFGAAATRLPLSMLGLLQYITPIVIFTFGVTIFHDSMSTSRWIGFLIVWVALLVFSVDAIRHAKKAGDDRRGVIAQSLEVTEPD
jgi:chloramphenicol-sensitive protein RarD